MANGLRCIYDECGAVFVEAAVTMTIMLVVVLGSIDFLFVFYQWNLASEALEVGARVASVSNPVARGLHNLAQTAERSLPVGSPMPSFLVTCNGDTSACTCTGFCVGLGGFDLSALNTIVYGRGSASCSERKSITESGMCSIFPRIKPENVVVTYAEAGIGYVGRPAGVAPTITVELQHLPLQFFFLGSFIKLHRVNIDASASTIAGDLSSVAPD